MIPSSVVVDTNVALTANGSAEHAGPQCVLRCLEELEVIQRERRVVLDEAGLILEEYLRQRPHGFPRDAGDLFLVWLYDNQANPQHVQTVPITPLKGHIRGFEEFPDDPDLATFDPSDRKFVAAALACGDGPPILNATDSDWWHHRKALNRNGVKIQFLCPELVSGKR